MIRLKLRDGSAAAPKVTLQELPVGAMARVYVNAEHTGRWGEYLNLRIAAHDHHLLDPGYPADAVTLCFDNIIQMLPFDAKEPNNANSDRKSYGNNNYNYSNLRQWLNSNAAAGAWYSGKHSADSPPNSTNVSVNAYDTRAGFLSIFDAAFVNALMETTLTVVKNTVTDGGSYETVTDKIFLASTTEVGLANENSIAEGSILSWFNTSANRIAYCTQAAIDTSAHESDPTTSAAWYWWLRTPHASSAGVVRSVNTDGTLSLSGAYDGSRGVRPLCNLPMNTRISDTPNADGSFDLLL